MLPLPTEGRVYRDERRVRLGDADPARRLRLDAVARYLQDVAEDDAAEGDLPPSIGWVLRRTRLLVHRFPTLGEVVALATFCSGVAPRWAERTTTVTGDRGGLLQATSVWVAIDIHTGAPARLGERFHQVYGPAAGGRRASARLVLEGPTDAARRDARLWPLRTSDLDLWGHVNNAVAWAAVEDAADLGRWAPALVELEHHRAIEPGCRPMLAVARTPASVGVWLLDGGSAGSGGNGGDTGRGVSSDLGGDAGSDPRSGSGSDGAGGGQVLVSARVRPLEGDQLAEADPGGPGPGSLTGFAPADAGISSGTR